MNDVSNGVWWTAIAPGIAILMLVLAFALLGEGLGDYLDPRFRSTLNVRKLLAREEGAADGASAGAAAPASVKGADGNGAA